MVSFKRKLWGVFSLSLHTFLNTTFIIRNINPKALLTRYVLMSYIGSLLTFAKGFLKHSVANGGEWVKNRLFRGDMKQGWGPNT
jgi:hypothetical protein